MQQEHIYTRWIEINLDAIVHNFIEIRKHVPSQVKILAVVKSDAYGYGAVEVARALEDAGADMLAVTTLEEGMELVQNGLHLPILVFAPLLPCQAQAVLQYRLIPTVDSLEAMEALAGAAGEKKARAGFHLKVETGMGRNGILPEDIGSFVNRLKELPFVEMQGVYSHLATAMMANQSFAGEQREVFCRVLKHLEEAQCPCRLAHLANSAAILRFPEMHFDMVRAGTLIYGQYPSSHVPQPLDLLDPWSVKARVLSVKQLSAGASIGYGRDYVARKPARAAVVPLGYADGFGIKTQTRPVRVREIFRSLARDFSILTGLIPQNYVRWQEQKLPVLGRIGMQLSMVDVTGKSIRAGDVVEIPLRRTTAGARLPRIYMYQGRVQAVRDVYKQ